MSKLKMDNNIFLNILRKILSCSIITIIGLISLTNLINAANAGNPNTVEKLPYCGNEAQRDISRRLLFVTTLDGKLTALDISKDGSLKWSLSTTPGPLLSSSIHRLELTNNGQWVRMIPSLSGGLYKFDRESIEPIPVTADQLLSASFKFSDDLVISGGKETRSYGVSSRTGKIIYECSIHGCQNSTHTNEMENEQRAQPRTADDDNNDEDTDHDPLIDDVIVVRRHTQTVRAVEPRTGGERWNFSVGHHEMEILKTEDCHERPFSELDLSLLDLELKVVVPEGIICAFNKNTPHVILWKHKFDHPIVSAWKSDINDNLQSIDLFSSSQWIWNNDGDIVQTKLSPSIYVGMFNKQLYIQESIKLQQQALFNAQLNDHLDGKESTNLRIPWKPFPATTSALALIEEDINQQQKIPLNIEDNNNNSEELDGESASVTALSVLYASEYINGNGFYLYTDLDFNRTQNSHCVDNTHNHTINEVDNQTLEYLFNENDFPTAIMKLLSYYWKEILVLSFTIMLIFNVMILRYLKTQTEIIFVERHIEVPGEQQQELQQQKSLQQYMPEEEPMSLLQKPEPIHSARTLSESSNNNNDSFISRFSNDFDMIQCLGKGGFGVVFEAKNKLDDCNYAIKRIILPNKQESRERVMREVKTLAHCEHQNIVRYFQAWVETPPPGWQEKEDKIWMDHESSSHHCIDIETPTSDLLLKSNSISCDKSISTNYNDTNINKKNTFGKITKTNFIYNYSEDLISYSSSNNFTNRNYNHNNNNIDDDDSFEIEFKHSSMSNISDDADDTNDNDDDTSKKHESDNDKSSSTDDNIFSYKKKRTQSECTDYVIPMSNCWQNEAIRKSNVTLSNYSRNFDIESVTSGGSGASGSKTSVTNNSNCRLSQFKKTHTRPKSLDLTNRGNVIRPYLANRMYLYIQMQLCKKQSLKDWLRLNNLNVRQTKILPIFEQIVGAVEYVHLKGLIHRDLKPSNIFFSLDDQIKIGDFGLVTDMSDIPNTSLDTNINSTFIIKHTEQVGTHLYMSPEQLQGRQYNYKVDIYSLGLIYFELLVAFGTEMERVETLKALRLCKFPNDFQTNFQDEFKLLKLMVSKSPNERPTTIGIRAMKPLNISNAIEITEYAFELPPRRRDSHINNISSSNSSNSTNDIKLSKS